MYCTRWSVLLHGSWSMKTHNLLAVERHGAGNLTFTILVGDAVCVSFLEKHK